MASKTVLLKESRIVQASMLTRCGFFWLALAGGGWLCAQTQMPQNAPEISTQDSSSTFKSKVNLVPIPVVVRDREGHAIGTLKKEDFRIFDRGKLQVISRFSVEKSGGGAAIVAATESNESAGGTTTAASNVTQAVIPRRFVAYLFDDLHFEFGDLARVQKAAIHHLQTALAATDRAAIYTTSGQGGLDFTDDRAKLQQAVMKLRMRQMYRQSATDCPYMTYYLADRILNKNDQMALQAAAQDTIQCANLAGTNAQQQQQMAQSLVQAAAQPMIPTGEQDTRVTLDVVKQIVRRISVMPGQRMIVLVSPGFVTLTPESFFDKTDILDRAARGNVIISALDARGLYTDSALDASQTAAATPQMQALKQQLMHASDIEQADVLAELADGTGGGFFQNSNDLEGGLNRVAAAPEYVYMLGFSPQNLKMDGTFHTLKVTVMDAKGLSVQARRGYYTPKRLPNEEETAKEEIKDAIFSREEMHDIPVDLHTQFFKSDPADAKLTVLARVDLKHMRFKKLDGRNRNDLTVVAALFDRNGNYMMATQKTVEMRLRDETLARLNSGITVRSSFDVKPGTYLVRLVVRDAEGQMMSAQNGAVDIP